MSEKQKVAQENQKAPFDLSSCMEMMEQMMAGQGEGCDCTEMMSQVMGQGDCAVPSVISQMMAMCGGVVQGETKETTATEAS